MTEIRVEQIARALLYEGYLLYPYRPSVKNRQRWTFGSLCPQSYSEAQGGTDAWSMQTECLAQGNADATLTVSVRFLHLRERHMAKLVFPLTECSGDGDPPFEDVESLEVGGQLYQTWQEAVEREVLLDAAELGDLTTQPRQRDFAFPSERSLESLYDPDNHRVGVLMRQHRLLAGSVRLSAAAVEKELFKVTVQIANSTPLEEVASISRGEALLRSLVSTHTVLSVRGGSFVSLLDPPLPWRDVAAGCRNVGTWPVLVGNEGARDTILSSPIILYDYPQIAPESPGDLFDSTEIDEILSLRILTLTDEEKRAMASVDERARALLHRTESLAREQLLGLHGTIRGLQPVATEVGHE